MAHHPAPVIFECKGLALGLTPPGAERTENYGDEGGKASALRSVQRPHRYPKDSALSLGVGVGGQAHETSQCTGPAPKTLISSP